MRYYELTFETTPTDEAVSDVLAALLAEVGCEAFVPNTKGLTAYVQQTAYSEEAIDGVVRNFPLPDVSIAWTAAPAPYANWNETWEAEHHFEPILLPDGQQIAIRPRQAFGTGEHPTTRMMLQLLAEVDVARKRVVDAGCGTGILGIAALRMGASHVFAYDIDEWSVSNAHDNYQLNLPDAAATAADAYTIIEGTAEVLRNVAAVDVLMANINTSILLADMPQFVSTLRDGGHLLLSGFLTADTPLLLQAASRHGLRVVKTLTTDDWQALHLVKSVAATS